MRHAGQTYQRRPEARQRRALLSGHQVQPQHRALEGPAIPSSDRRGAGRERISRAVRNHMDADRRRQEAAYGHHRLGEEVDCPEERSQRSVADDWGSAEKRAQRRAVKQPLVISTWYLANHAERSAFAKY